MIYFRYLSEYRDSLNLSPELYPHLITKPFHEQDRKYSKIEAEVKSWQTPLTGLLILLPGTHFSEVTNSSLASKLSFPEVLR